MQSADFLMCRYADFFMHVTRDNKVKNRKISPPGPGVKFSDFLPIFLFYILIGRFAAFLIINLPGRFSNIKWQRPADLHANQ